MSSSGTGNDRLAAVQLLQAVRKEHCLLSEAKAGAEKPSAFARRLAYGVLRHEGAIDWILGQLLSKPLKKRDQDLQALLQTGIYQLWLEDTAPHAAVHATAECARLLNKKWATGLVNAVLRRFQREQEILLEKLQQQPARHSHPDWLLGQLRADWPEDWQDIVDANNQQAPMWLRTNVRKTSLESLSSSLVNSGFSVSQHDFAPQALKIEPAASVDDIPGFHEGSCSVQDPAAQLAAALIEPAPGHRVLDACAAPGGKSCHLLELNPGLDLKVIELNAERAVKIRENAVRLGLEIQPVIADATEPSAWFSGKPFDRILLDAPCSATGVIRRHPEIKWLRSTQQVKQAVALQARLLDALWPLLRPGGFLVYATCSILNAENAGQISSFLARQPDARCHRPRDFPGHWQAPGQQIFPGEQEMDGFYYAVLEKQA